MSTESPADRMPATFREWVEILARIRFGTVTVSGKNYRGAVIKAVAGRLASYADTDGTRVRPGIVRLAVDLEITYRTARDVVAYLRSVGMLQLVRAGGRMRADEFRLSLPVDLLERDDLEVWSPSRQRLEIERAQEAHRGTRKPPGGGGVHAPTDSAIQPDPPSVHAPTDSAMAPKSSSIAESRGACNPAIAESRGTPLLSPEGHATDQDRNTRATDQEMAGVFETVTTSRATGPTPNPDSSPMPKRCNHGLPGGRRDDGKPACAICRVAENQTRAAGHPPPEQNRLAPVIQLDPRRTA